MTTRWLDPKREQTRKPKTDAAAGASFSARVVRIALPIAFVLLVVALSAAWRPRPGVAPNEPAAPALRISPARDAALAETQGRFAAYLAADPTSPWSPPAGEAVWSELLRFYEQRAYLPAWFDGLTPRPQAGSLLAALGRLERPGGERPREVTAELERLLDLHLQAPAPEGAYELDLALTHAYLDASFERLYGRLQPATAGVPWRIPPRRTDLAAHLEAALSGFALERSLADLDPRHEQFQRLEAAHRRYRRIVAAGGWPEVGDGIFPGPRPRLEEGEAADPAHLATLARRLAAEGYLTPERAAAARERYDRELARAVEAFQRDRGLDPDGKLGPATLAALDVPAERRLRQIEVNLLRWRWLPEQRAARSVVVNIPAFRLDVVEEGSSVLSLRVMVGRKSWPTPIFQDEMESAVLNPAWNVPASIASREILPKLAADPGHLTAENLEAHAGWSGPEVTAGEIDLAAWRRNPSAYRLRQPPGPGNPLGRVKFLFPNRFNVYLHDTNARSLFARADRALSHGCVRVEEPFRLVEALFRDDLEWGGGRLEEAAATGRSRWVRVPGRVPVSLVYFTAHVRDDGGLELYSDVYGIDEAMIAALEAQARGAQARGAQEGTAPAAGGLYAPGLRVAFAPPAGGSASSPPERVAAAPAASFSSSAAGG